MNDGADEEERERREREADSLSRNGLTIRRRSGETWRACVERIAGEFGLAEECLSVFDHSDESIEVLRAWKALYEWDCPPVREGAP